ncbi:putative Integral membrane protein [Streptomyces viridochromogenes Tue57]|uniref:Putative Integral membrane protein n=1 Tax=Streptomyces viridochromogenes Tue57 TaxID=1160705 RepID=L8P9W6_STRVR|nr:putative Integral membrane protein [Streptomyces viridochromogenes Tue57]
MAQNPRGGLLDPLNVSTRFHVYEHVAPAELTLTRPPQQAPSSQKQWLRRFWTRHRIPLSATLPAVPLYALWWAFLATGGGDLAAQYAWAGFAARHGDSAYNLFWYGGTHTANYSLISPYLMAALGVRAVTVVSGLAATWLAAVLITRAEGLRRPLGPALLASFALWCNVASGRTTFALGVAFGLAACLMLSRGRRTVLAAACAALATMASPVAGLFLAVVGAAFLLTRDWRRALALLLPPAVTVGAISLLFPFKGEQLMFAGRIWPPFFLGLAVTFLAPRSWRVARWSGVVYAAGTVLTYLVASPVGTNVERFAELFAPAALLAVLLARPHLTEVRRKLLVGALVFSLGWVGFKTAADLRVSTTVPAWAAETQGVVRALDRLGADRTRVEVVPARNHREASGLAPHVNMARGWNRQLDMERARLFYDGSFSAATYRAWLDRWAVGFVVLPLGKPDGYAKEEARLVRDHRPDWLEPVWQDTHWRVHRVRDAVPLVSRPASVVSTSSADVVVRMARPGSATVRIAYSPWLRVDGGGCLTRQGEFTRLTVDAPGTYRLSSEYGPSPEPKGRC